jgi:hypothetical protein
VDGKVDEMHLSPVAALAAYVAGLNEAPAVHDLGHKLTVAVLAFLKPSSC